MSETTKKPVAVRALRNLEVDGVLLAEGTEGKVPAELLPALVECGAVEELPARGKAAS